MSTEQRIGSEEIQAAITRLADGIETRHPDPGKLLFLGIANGGVELARRLAGRFGARAGTLDISFHRDDIGQNPIPKEFAPTQIPADVHGAVIVLVDDVLFSGRTLKAALDELFDHGRPTKVEVAVLVDRGGRRLPLAADYVGIELVASEREDVVVTVGPTGGPGSEDSIRILPKRTADRRSPF